MSDYIIRGMAADKQVRFFAANTKDLVEKARRIHNTSPIATAPWKINDRNSDDGKYV